MITNSVEFPKLEDILNNLTGDLEERCFERMDERDTEFIRYKKTANSAGFEVGLEQVYEADGEPDFDSSVNNIYLNIAVDVPPNITNEHLSDALPSDEVMRGILFRNKPNSNCEALEVDERVPSEKAQATYCIGFKKGYFNADEMRAALRETINYFCESLTATVHMINNSERLDK